MEAESDFLHLELRALQTPGKLQESERAALSLSLGASLMPAEQPHVRVRDSGGIRVVEFTDRKILEEISIHEIGEELGRIIDESSDVKMLLSFKNVDHLSSAALGMLINLNKQVAAKNGALKLSDISPQIFEVFKITRLNKLFDIHPTMADAIAAFG